jgi:hypothetical protein
MFWEFHWSAFSTGGVPGASPALAATNPTTAETRKTITLIWSILIIFFAWRIVEFNHNSQFSFTFLPQYKKRATGAGRNPSRLVLTLTILLAIPVSEFAVTVKAVHLADLWAEVTLQSESCVHGQLGGA